MQNPEQIDNYAVQRFAQALKERLAVQRNNGYWGWETIPDAETLRREFHEAVKAGSVVDAANYLCFMHTRGISL